MLENTLIKQLIKHQSIKKLYEVNKLELNQYELDKCWIDLCELRSEYDPEYYFSTYETIEDGLSGELIPFVMTSAQRKFHYLVMQDIEANSPVRIITLKARQRG